MGRSSLRPYRRGGRKYRAPSPKKGKKGTFSAKGAEEARKKAKKYRPNEIVKKVKWVRRAGTRSDGTRVYIITFKKRKK